MIHNFFLTCPPLLAHVCMLPGCPFSPPLQALLSACACPYQAPCYTPFVTHGLDKHGLQTEADTHMHCRRPRRLQAGTAPWVFPPSSPPPSLLSTGLVLLVLHDSAQATLRTCSGCVSRRLCCETRPHAPCCPLDRCMWCSDESCGAVGSGTAGSLGQTRHQHCRSLPPLRWTSTAACVPTSRG